MKKYEVRLSLLVNVWFYETPNDKELTDDIVYLYDINGTAYVHSFFEGHDADFNRAVLKEEYKNIKFDNDDVLSKLKDEGFNNIEHFKVLKIDISDFSDEITD